ncbi:MAG: hypothetical protein HKO59_06635 [Phycisphaerales bacterium]|nr:hypothetical protein [Phycisphaerae bacterium]NNF43400.1 hypothetical protein [Phycisphaerales bacterium]NNM25652.1 hypothetical protein [Phycisphaerales bacterium]
MAHRIRQVDYYYTTIEDAPGSSFEVLSRLAELGVNLIAIAALPLGPTRTQLTVFPEDDAHMERTAGAAGMTLDGPHPALLVQGDDELGALVGVHERLASAGINVYSSIGVTDGKGDYGYVVYLRPDEVDRALKTLGV